MDIRVVLKENPAAATAATGALIALAILVVILELHSFGGSKTDPIKKLYFTTDDGATFYSDDVTQIPPYTHDGKTAYRAFVYKSGSGKTWVQYVGRYRPAAKAKLEEKAGNLKTSEQSVAFITDLNEGYDIKPPLTGDTGWVDPFSQQGARIAEIHPPAGASGLYEPAYP